MDKISQLSLKEDLPADNPIVEETKVYYLISDNIVTVTRYIVTSEIVTCCIFTSYNRDRYIWLRQLATPNTRRQIYLITTRPNTT